MQKDDFLFDLCFLHFREPSALIMTVKYISGLIHILTEIEAIIELPSFPAIGCNLSLKYACRDKSIPLHRKKVNFSVKDFEES